MYVPKLDLVTDALFPTAEIGEDMAFCATVMYTVKQE